MANVFTKRNHYNPCFWTACWNPKYFQALIQDQSASFNPRDQEVFVLNLISRKIYLDKVNNIHFEKDLGVAEITPESMNNFCRRYLNASDYENFCKSLEENPESLFLNFEDILTAIERFKSYQSLMDAVKVCGIQNPMQKGFLTCHIVIQAMRSHEMMNSMIDSMNSIGMPKWEYFWRLKNALGNKIFYNRAATALALSRWTLYVTDNHTYPLCDSPVMVRQNTLMVILSPRILLEINLNEPSPETAWTIREGVNFSKFREFRRRSINNAFKEIIFHNRNELEIWRNTKEFKERSRDLQNKEKARQLREEAAKRVIWAIDGFGRHPKDFDNP